MASPAPMAVSAASAVLLALVATLAPALSAYWVYLVAANSVIEPLILQVFLLNTAPGGRVYAGLVVVRLAMLAVLMQVRGALAHSAGLCALAASALVVGMSALSARSDVMGRVAAAAGRKRVTPFHFGLVAWALALLFDAPWVFFWGNAFLASALQGVSHRLAGEEGTLVNLQASPEQTTAHELSHTVYFPDLLLHTVFERVRGIGPKGTGKSGSRK